MVIVDKNYKVYLVKIVTEIVPKYSELYLSVMDKYMYNAVILMKHLYNVGFIVIEKKTSVVNFKNMNIIVHKIKLEKIPELKHIEPFKFEL